MAMQFGGGVMHPVYLLYRFKSVLFADSTKFKNPLDDILSHTIFTTHSLKFVNRATAKLHHDIRWKNDVACHGG